MSSGTARSANSQVNDVEAASSSSVERIFATAMASGLSAVADSGQTMLCGYLSAVLLVGLVADATLGWW